jgi:hypothetical protein
VRRVEFPAGHLAGFERTGCGQARVGLEEGRLPSLRMIEQGPEKPATIRAPVEVRLFGPGQIFVEARSFRAEAGVFPPHLSGH